MQRFRVLLALATVSLACAPLFGETTKTAEASKKAGEAKSVFAKFDKNGDGKWSKEEHEADLKDRFAEMDANKDGKITADEVAASWKARRAVMDTNRDGAVTVDECLIYATGKPPRKGLKPADTMDGPDKDGVITEDEYAAYFLMRFEKGDLNKDGKLTPDEVDGAAKAYVKLHNKDADDTLEENELP